MAIRGVKCASGCRKAVELALQENSLGGLRLVIALCLALQLTPHTTTRPTEKSGQGLCRGGGERAWGRAERDDCVRVAMACVCLSDIELRSLIAWRYPPRVVLASVIEHFRPL